VKRVRKYLQVIDRYFSKNKIKLKIKLLLVILIHQKIKERLRTRGKKELHCTMRENLDVIKPNYLFRKQ
jgi:hypothetical protein